MWRRLLLFLLLLFIPINLDAEKLQYEINENDKLQCIAWTIELNEYQLEATDVQLEAMFIASYMETLTSYYNFLKNKMYVENSVGDSDGFNRDKMELNRTMNYFLFQKEKHLRLNESLEENKISQIEIFNKLKICPEFEADHSEVIKACRKYKSIKGNVNCKMSENILKEKNKNTF